MSAGNRMQRLQQIRNQNKGNEELTSIQLPMFFVGTVVIVTSLVNGFLLAPRRIDDVMPQRATIEVLPVIMLGSVALAIGGIGIIVFGALVPRHPVGMAAGALIVFVGVVLISFFVDALPILSWFTIIKIVTGIVLVKSLQGALALRRA